MDVRAKLPVDVESCRKRLAGWLVGLLAGWSAALSAGSLEAHGMRRSRAAVQTVQGRVCHPPPTPELVGAASMGSPQARMSCVAGRLRVDEMRLRDLRFWPAAYTRCVGLWSIRCCKDRKEK